MLTITGLVGGPYATEKQFETAVIQRLAILFPSVHWFAIETEETTPGFPDILGSSNVLPAVHIECKMTEKDSENVKFKKSQPMFYKREVGMRIVVLVWDRNRQRVVLVSTDEVLERKALTIKVPASENFRAYEARQLLQLL